MLPMVEFAGLIVLCIALELFHARERAAWAKERRELERMVSARSHREYEALRLQGEAAAARSRAPERPKPSAGEDHAMREFREKVLASKGNPTRFASVRKALG